MMSIKKRNFLIKRIKAVAALLGAGSLQAKSQEPPGDKTKIKMLTPDGKLVWVDMQDYKPDLKPPITNEELYTWINPVKDGPK
jgi:hypothetical protein